MSDIVQLMQSRFRSLLMDFELTFSAEQISHAAERGRLLEETLSKFLISALPKRVGVGSGQVVGASEEIPSKQVDIVLYDAINYPLLLNEGSFQLFPNEAVFGVIEVKSKLNKKYLREGVININSVKILRKFPSNTHPQTLGVLFCYKTTWKRPLTLFRNLQQLSAANIEKVPDVICSLDPGFLIVKSNTMGKSVSRMATPLAGMEKEDSYSPDSLLFIKPSHVSFREHILLWLYLLILDHANRIFNIGVNMAQYTKSPTGWAINEVDLVELKFI